MSLPIPDSSRQPGHMRVGDTDRTIVADLLSAAYAEGRLTREEHDSRLEQAMAAKTYDDLRVVTRDLVPITEERVVGAFNASGYPRARSTTGGKTDTTMAIFSGVERKGAWHVSPSMLNISLFGGSAFDFTDAVFDAPEITFDLGAVFGGIDIKVPQGVNVRNETVAIFGGTSIKRVDPVPGAPTIVLRGLVLFGGVDVKGPRR